MKKISYLSILLVSLVLFVFGCQDSTNPINASISDQNTAPRLAKAEIITFEDTFSYPFSLLNKCTGENITGTIYLKSRWELVVDENGGAHGSLHMVITGDAVGETSGTKYKGIETDYDRLILNSRGNYVEEFLLNSMFISQGSSDNLLEKTLIRATITPDGEIKAVVISNEFNCQG